MRPILSIVVPTRNRYVYLTSFIDVVKKIDPLRVELIIQDNSDDNTGFITDNPNLNLPNIKYFYNYPQMPISDNADLAILNSSGKYVCFMGDDDTVSTHILKFVDYMDVHGIESAFFQKASYTWPGINFVAHKFPSLIVNRFDGKIRFSVSAAERTKCLRRGGTSLELLPRVYHGIVSREALNRVYDRTGSFFPGPSPDMANSMALSFVVPKSLVFNYPAVVSGGSPGSGSGKGAEHKHTNELKNLAFLPADIEETWDEKIPRRWTGPTIYTQSVIASSEKMNENISISPSGYSYLYAHLYCFNKECRPLLKQHIRNYFTTLFYFIIIFTHRGFKFINNYLKVRGLTWDFIFDDITDTVKATEIIDRLVEEKWESKNEAVFKQVL